MIVGGGLMSDNNIPLVSNSFITLLQNTRVPL